MTGPPWLVGGFAVLMLLVTACCAARLVIGRLRDVGAEPDADALHVLMGVAMAGMFEPGLSLVPGVVWLPVFAAAAVWFGYRAIRAAGIGSTVRARCAYPFPHAVECAAMVYMLWPAGRALWLANHARAMPMPGMTGPYPAMTGNMALTFVLAIFMLGHIIWTADRLASRSVAGATGRPTLAPRLAACFKIAMSAAMGYMLVTML